MEQAIEILRMELKKILDDSIGRKMTEEELSKEISITNAMRKLKGLD